MYTFVRHGQTSLNHENLISKKHKPPRQFGEQQTILARTLIRGFAYSYIRVLPDEFLLNSIQIDQFEKKRTEHEYTPTQINILATSLLVNIFLQFKPETLSA